MEVLLTTVQVKIKARDGTFITLRALLDQGSQVNLITENAAQLLRLPRNKFNATVSGVGSVSGDCKGCVQLTCKSIHNDYTFNTQALVMKKLTNNIPNCTFPKANWPHLQNLKLGDPDFNISSTVDLLFSADVYAEIIMDGVLKGDQHSPVAQQTQLGWILCGKLQTLNCHLAIIDLADISKYWDNEDITQGVEDINKDDHCENYYNKTTKRGSDGKYIVKMPMKENFELQLGKSKPTAVSQYLQLEKRLAKNTKLSIMYKNFINEYFNLQHMKPSSPISKASESQECYLPHHGVLRENSITTKLRVVFNASSKTSSGKSLNDLMEKGPNLQKDIQSLILKWRSYKYAFTADIEKMYRCIWISADQQHLQKIIWRPSSTETLQEYTLCTLTYGTKCAPWLAMRTLKQLAMDDGHKYPAAADTLKNEFYVDDLISGYNSLEGAKELQTTLIRLLKGGGFNLRKWSSNCPELLENLTEDQISTNNTFDFKQESTTNTLGLGWNPNLDAFIFNWNIKNTSKKPLTKRILLSEISQLYDPLGWLSPVTITAKIIFQRVWELNLGWDEQLPAEIQNDWLKLREQISVLKTIKINRWIGGTKKFIDLYGFCDASEKAYACIVYTRVINENGEPVVNLLTAKTRVAPLAQKITLPRLELCGALLLSQLMEKAKQSLNDYILTIWAWSDSKVVLAWLQGEETKWERYVENRVKKIKQVIPPRQWSYIESKSNPADCATRGVDPKNLLNLNLWWNGPEILKTFMGTYDKEPINCLFTSNIDKKGKVTTLEQNNDNIIVNIINKCSSLTRVKRIVAWIMRFIKNIRNNSTAVKPDTASYQMALGTYLTSSELLAANKLIIRFIQRKELEMEYNSLTKKQFLNTKSPIYKLYPYLDEDGIIRVGGRLNKTNLPLGMKNPIILPRKGKFTQLIIEEAHATTLHGGARLTLAFIRQRYWIVGGNRAVKTQLRHCVRCLRYKTTNNYQLMADLPPQRAIPSRPFTHTGVDFTGHVDVKLNKGRGVKTCKGYIAIFVCMATKAVHIELVSDLSTHTFIAALQRLCARRGTPKHMYSDCGTNFIGASKVLKTEFELFKTELPPEFFDEIVKMEIEWHFNAPAWPSAGGLWEAAVRSMKQHLHRILGDQKLTYEEFTTLLTKIEACMNSRPICPLTEDPEDFYSYLTPGHFLTGSPMLTLPLSNYEDERNLNLRQRWQLTEHMMQRFWKLWSNDYLTQLQARSKWQKPTKNMAIGDIVLVKENNLPPGKWAMGRVIDVHPGEDGHVRVTTVKTQSGVIKRPIVKLSKLLPMEPEDMENETVTPYSSNRCKPAKKKGFICMFLSFLSIFTLTTPSYCVTTDVTRSMTQNAHITNLGRERPIYYDTMGKIQLIHDEWILLTYYNLTTYWQSTQDLGTFLEEVKILCQKLEPRYCENTIQQLFHEMELLNYRNDILLAPHKHLSDRKKRGLIDGVGYAANSLFGILDQRFADKYQQDIQAIQNNEKYLSQLLKNQTTIVEIENNIMRKNDKNIRYQFDLINKFMNDTGMRLAKLESRIGTVLGTNYFSSVSLTAHLLLSNLKNIQDMFFNALIDAYKGHIDVHLLTPVNLMKQLTEISGKLPKTLTLPVENIEEQIKELYKLLYAKARVTNNYFMYEIHIPLTSDEEFTLYRAIPLPLKTKQEEIDTYVTVSFKYIAVNFRKNTFASLNEERLNQCIQRSTDNFVCTLNLPIGNLASMEAPCEAKLLSHGTTTPCYIKRKKCESAWFELHSTNTWLVVCCDSCAVRTVCAGDVASYQLNMSALITLNQGCVIQTKDLSIYAQNLYHSDSTMDLDLAKTPKVEQSINSMLNSQRIPQLQLLPEEKDLKMAGELLEQQRNNEILLPSTITNHDIHQYSLCYALVAVVVITTLIWVSKKRGWCRKRQYTPKRSTKQESFDLPLSSQQSGPTNIKLQGLPLSTKDLRNDEPLATLEQREPPQPQPRREQENDIVFDFN